MYNGYKRLQYNTKGYNTNFYGGSRFLWFKIHTIHYKSSVLRSFEKFLETPFSMGKEMRNFSKEIDETTEIFTGILNKYNLKNITSNRFNGVTPFWFI